MAETYSMNSASWNRDAAGRRRRKMQNRRDAETAQQAREDARVRLQQLVATRRAQREDDAR